MNLRLIRIMLAVPLVLLLAAGTTVIALREPIAVKTPGAHLAEVAVTIPPTPPPVTPVAPAAVETPETVSAPIEQGVDYHKLTSDLEEAASALEGAKSPIPTLAGVLRKLERKASGAEEQLNPVMDALAAALSSVSSADRAASVACAASDASASDDAVAAVSAARRSSAGSTRAS